MRGPWTVPAAEQPAITASASQLAAFVRFCEQRTGERFADHSSFHSFSVTERDRFWSLFLEWAQLAHEGSPAPVCTSDDCETRASSRSSG